MTVYEPQRAKPSWNQFFVVRPASCWKVPLQRFFFNSILPLSAVAWVLFFSVLALLASFNNAKQKQEKKGGEIQNKMLRHKTHVDLIGAISFLLKGSPQWWLWGRWQLLRCHNEPLLLPLAFCVSLLFILREGIGIGAAPRWELLTTGADFESNR